jgi:hypothetical protein
VCPYDWSRGRPQGVEGRWEAMTVLSSIPFCSCDSRRVSLRYLPAAARYVTARFIGDGMYDQAPVYAAVARHSPGARVIVPPRKDAVVNSQGATSPTQRDPHLLDIERAGRFVWKRMSGYYAQSHAENAFSRYKRTFGGGLRAKREEAQEREAAIACRLLNQMRELGRPQSSPVS